MEGQRNAVKRIRVLNKWIIDNVILDDFFS
jgi:hypothetical protein